MFFALRTVQACQVAHQLCRADIDIGIGIIEVECDVKKCNDDDADENCTVGNQS